MHSFSCSDGTTHLCRLLNLMPLPIISPISSSVYMCTLCIHTIICIGQRLTTMSLFCCVLSLLLLFASAHSVLRTQGRALLAPQGEEDGGAGVTAAMIGSRPPRCEGRCLSCGQCEAVQVPAIPQERTPAGRFAAATVSSRGSGGDDDGGGGGSIYKPLSWKCKCGGMILNP